jgi:hypothetical protein
MCMDTSTLRGMRWWEIGEARDEDGDQLSQMGHLPDRKHVSGPERSVMRELLGDEEADRYEIAAGRWYLPGTPP